MASKKSLKLNPEQAKKLTEFLFEGGKQKNLNKSVPAMAKAARGVVTRGAARALRGLEPSLNSAGAVGEEVAARAARDVSAKRFKDEAKKERNQRGPVKRPITRS